MVTEEERSLSGDFDFDQDHQDQFDDLFEGLKNEDLEEVDEGAENVYKNIARQ